MRYSTQVMFFGRLIAKLLVQKCNSRLKKHGVRLNLNKKDLNERRIITVSDQQLNQQLSDLNNWDKRTS